MKIKKFKDLSDDIIALSKLDDGTYEEIKEPITILQVTGLITDEKELSKIEEAFTLDTSVVVKDIKRGDILYLTALLEKSNTTSRNAQNWGVIKVRIVDYYWGLSKLNTLPKNTNK
jgi:hypothetical protein